MLWLLLEGRKMNLGISCTSFSFFFFQLEFLVLPCYAFKSELLALHLSAPLFTNFYDHDAVSERSPDSQRVESTDPSLVLF